MTHRYRNTYPIVLFLLLITAPAARAMPAITCHCFTDRTFDPARPAVADPYFLATTQNSFISAVFNIDKKSIVMKKQTGTSADDLWIAHGIAARTGGAVEDLLDARQRKAGWKEIIASFHIAPKTLGARLQRELQARAPDSRLAGAVVDDLFARYHLLDDTELATMRKRGATNQELIIATVIGAKLRRPAGDVFQVVKRGTKSWGALLHEAHIAPADIPGEITRLLELVRP